MNIQIPNYPPHEALTARALTEVTKLIIHHGANSPDQSPLAVDQEHRNQGWIMIGYSFYITGDGTVYQGRPMATVPAAAQGHNTESVDVCLAGNFQPDDSGFTGTPTTAQWESLKELSVQIHKDIPTIDATIGHRDVNATACPGSLLYVQLADLRAYVVAQMAGSPPSGQNTA